MIVIFTVLCLIYGIDGGSDTCCYGRECPLPVANEYAANWTWLVTQANIMSDNACCPSGGYVTIHQHGDLTSACVCSETQTCDAYDSSNAITCKNYYNQCPDSNFNGVNYNFTNGQIGINYCVYTPDGTGIRGMSQRCPDQEICFRDATSQFHKYDGTYQYDGFRNGFTVYNRTYGPYHYDAHIAVYGTYPYRPRWWLVILHARRHLPDPTDFGDVTTMELIESGACPFVPTTTETSSTITTTKWRNPNGNMDSTSDYVRIAINISIIIGGVVVGICIIAAVIVGLRLWWKKRKANSQNNEYLLQNNERDFQILSYGIQSNINNNNNKNENEDQVCDQPNVFDDIMLPSDPDGI